MIKKSGRFDVIVKFESDKIAELSTNDFEKVDSLFDGVRKKFKGGL